MNAFAHMGVSTLTIGVNEGSEAKLDANGQVMKPFRWNLWEVTDEDIADGYMSSYMFGRFGWEAAGAALTAGAATGLKGAGWAGRASRLVMRADTAKNVVMGAKGAADIRENGLNWQNGLQVAGAFLGARGNLKAMNGAGMGGRANRLLNTVDEFLINNRATRALGSGAGLATGALPRMVDWVSKQAAGRRLIGGTLHQVFDGTRYQSAMQKTADWLRLKACFGAGTKLLTKGPWGEGWREIEQITTDDFVASRDENNPCGAIEWKAVEELFRRTAPLLSLTVNGQVIRTTAEHPFYHEERGWTPAGDLEVGDRLVGKAGEAIVVGALESEGDFEAVYNLRVADFHTYFVGDDRWGFGVWAHNSYSALRAEGLTKSQAKRANMLYKTQGESAVRAYLERQGFSGPRLDDLTNAARSARTGAQRGPNATSGHSATIEAEAARLRAEGNTIIAGGGGREKTIKTPGGIKETRRPDILFRTPDGELRGVNVGRRMDDGSPVPREVEALADLNGPGRLPMTSISYN